jgi:hypothetical protein
METPPPLPVAEEAKWPMKTILFVGYFGNKSPEGRRYHNRYCIASVLFVIALFTWLLVTPRLPHSVPIDPLNGIIFHLLLGGLFSFIAWSFWKYLQELDELARGMQLQAIALTYLTGLGAMSFLGLLGIVAHWNIDPLVAFMLLEPVRGFWLWRLARRYQ